jgi:hypothetical protein
VLSQRLGVSTHTIQRILVDGRVPHFGKRVGPRQSLAWARTITRLAVRLGAKPRSWIESVGIVWTEEVAAASRSLEARLREEARTPASSAPATSAALPDSAGPAAFADPTLQRALAQRLLEELWNHRALLHASAAQEAQSAMPRSSEREFEAIVSIARTMVAPQWRAILEEEAWAFRKSVLPDTELPESAPHHCYSCSQSLQEHPGRSALYCQYCSDEEGQLLPREEVHKLIAGWMRWWQPNLSEEESLLRATLYMSVMPAWSDKG